MNASPSTFPVIPALVYRHVQDAAFYWSQLDWTLGSPLVGLERLHHFHRLRDAHLDGIETAGSAGWDAAYASLERWRKPGEAFCCVTVAARRRHSAQLDQVSKLICRHPGQLVRGAVSALAWCDDDDFASVAHQWSGDEAEPAVQVAVLRAVGLKGRHSMGCLRHPLSHYMQASDPHIRGAAWRAIGSVTAEEHTGEEALATLRARALSDADLAVRAEAAIASMRHAGPAALPVLWACVEAQVALQRQATGWPRAQGERRLRRWVRHLALAVPLQSPLVPSALALLPPREALTFVFYHGDLAQLPFVVDQMADPGVGRYAGWVWYCLTGLDLSAHGLTLAETPPGLLDASQPVTDAQLDADNGLRQPDAAAVRRFMQGWQVPTHDERVLLGGPLNVERAVDVLRHAPQALRAIVSHMLAQREVPVRIDVRGRIRDQLDAIDRMEEWMNEGVAA